MKDFFNNLKKSFKMFVDTVKKNPQIILIAVVFCPGFFVPIKWSYHNTTYIFTDNGSTVDVKVNGWIPLTLFGLIGLPDFYYIFGWQVFEQSNIFAKHWSYKKLRKYNMEAEK